MEDDVVVPYEGFERSGGRQFKTLLIKFIVFQILKEDREYK